MKHNFKRLLMTAALVTTVGATTAFASEPSNIMAMPTFSYVEGTATDDVLKVTLSSQDSENIFITRGDVGEIPMLIRDGAGFHSSYKGDFKVASDVAVRHSFFVDNIDERIDANEELTEEEKAQLKDAYAAIKPVQEKMRELSEKLMEATDEERKAIREEIAELSKELSEWSKENDELLKKIMPQNVEFSAEGISVSALARPAFIFGDMTDKINESSELTDSEKATLIESNSKINEINEKIRALHEEMNEIMEKDAGLWEKANLGIGGKTTIHYVAPGDVVEGEWSVSDFTKAVEIEDLN